MRLNIIKNYFGSFISLILISAAFYRNYPVIKTDDLINCNKIQLKLSRKNVLLKIPSDSECFL